MGDKYWTDKIGATYENEIWSFCSGINLEDQLDWSCEKWSITYSQGEKEYSTCNKKKEG